MTLIILLVTIDFYNIILDTSYLLISMNILLVTIVLTLIDPLYRNIYSTY